MNGNGLTNGSWYCTKCGTWVASGVYHVCGGGSQPSAVLEVKNDTRLDRVIELLEQILRELRKHKLS